MKQLVRVEDPEKPRQWQCKYVNLPEIMAKRLPESLLVQPKGPKSRVYVVEPVQEEQVEGEEEEALPLKFSQSHGQFKDDEGENNVIELEEDEELEEEQLPREPLPWVSRWSRGCLSKDSCLVRGYTLPIPKQFGSYELKLPEFLMKPVEYKLTRSKSTLSSQKETTGEFISVVPLHPSATRQSYNPDAAKKLEEEPILGTASRTSLSPRLSPQNSEE
jgi:hypothetical protein